MDNSTHRDCEWLDKTFEPTIDDVEAMNIIYKETEIDRLFKEEAVEEDEEIDKDQRERDNWDFNG